MRNRRRIWGVAAAALLLGGTLAAPSRAAVITVENGGFAEPNFGADATATSNTIPDWHESAVTPFIPSGGGAYGVTDPAPANNPVHPTEGDQIAYMVLTDSAGGTNARGIWQVTSGQLVA